LRDFAAVGGFFKSLIATWKPSDVILEAAVVTHQLTLPNFIFSSETQSLSIDIHNDLPYELIHEY